MITIQNRMIKILPRQLSDPEQSQKTNTYIPNLSGKSYEQIFANVVHHVMTQYSLKAGIKKFGKKGEDAAYEELEQLHMRDTFKPVLPSYLNKENHKSFRITNIS